MRALAVVLVRGLYILGSSSPIVRSGGGIGHSMAKAKKNLQFLCAAVVNNLPNIHP